MVHTFPKGICPKVNVIVRLEYELAYNDSAVHRFNHFTTRTIPFRNKYKDMINVYSIVDIMYLRYYACFYEIFIGLPNNI